MSVSGINWLNIFFMIISAVLAVKLPFETFLFSYAVLGPLHYFTEINWLKTRNYFIKSTDNLVFRVIAVLVLGGLILSSLGAINFYTKAFAPINNNSFFGYLQLISNPVNRFFLFTSLWIAIAFIVTERAVVRVILIATGILTGLAFFALYEHLFVVYCTLFLPTIIHVWIFTGLFILNGAIKSKSFSGWLSFGIYILIAYILFDIKHNMHAYKPSSYVRDSFIQSNFQMVNAYIYDFFFKVDQSKSFMLNSNIGMQIQSLIAFAYTYHYLNWFSKTSIIKWHEMGLLRLIIIVTLWVVSLGLYYYDYRVGLAVLYFVSVLHVILEFPLNIIVIKELWNSFISIFISQEETVVQKL
jgi:hypothetical protein